MKHAWGYATEQRLRDENQDSHGVFVFDDFTLAIVCDGMGGHVGGAEASAIAVRTVWETMTELQGRPVGQSLQKAIVAANEAIYAAARKYRRYMGMGTTVVAVAVEGNVAHIAHVGDSRLYAIRDGEAHLLTRDHTMVNLFVEAELLSPEDAAAHPEAHVLARSLGVEPTVEVDLQDPLELDPGDVLVLCSDGLHGPIDDSTLGELDWNDLPKACEILLQMVRDNEGDDNATVAVVGLDIESSPEVPPTPPPSPVDLERRALEAEEEAGLSTDRHEPRPPMLYDEAQAAVAEAQGAQAAEAAQLDVQELELEELEPEPIQEVEIGLEGAVPTTTAQPASSRNRALVAAAAGLGVLLMAGVVTAILGSGESGSGVVPEDQEAEVALLTPTGAATTAESRNPLTDTDVLPTVANVPPLAGTPEASSWVFAPEPPKTRRRYSHRARLFVQPPPGGTLQLEIVKAARENRCAAALDTTRRAMRQSSDYGALYGRVWECFDEYHHAALVNASAPGVEEFRPVLPHFEGLIDTTGPIPAWFKPATGGIEARLAAYEESTEVDRFAEAIHDLRGPEAVTDQLMRDVLLEAEAAAGLSRQQNPSEEVVQWWARRVFQAGRALESPLGPLLEEYRPAQREHIVALLDDATAGGWSNHAQLSRVPEPVREAVLVASGVMSAPSRLQSVAARPLPKPEPEPEPEPEDLTPTIHRIGP